MLNREALQRLVPPSFVAGTDAWLREICIGQLCQINLLVEILAVLSDAPIKVSAADLIGGVLPGVGTGRESLAATVLLETPEAVVSAAGEIGGQNG